MAPPKTFGGVTGSQAFSDWVRRVADGTGISQAVVTAWVLAENGSPEKTDPRNPLNVQWRTQPKDYVSSAQATVALLRQPKYAPVLAAARTGNDAATVAAIAASPWDACHYRGTNPDKTCATNPPGTLLNGTLERVKRIGVHGATTPGITLPHIPSPSDAVNAVGDAVDRATSWLARESVVALAYVTLTVAALVLVLVGLMRATGITPAFARGALGERRAAASSSGGDVPF